MSQALTPSNSLTSSSTLLLRSNDPILDIRHDGDIIAKGKYAVQNTSDVTYEGLELANNNEIFFEYDNNISSGLDYDFKQAVTQLNWINDITQVSPNTIEAILDIQSNGSLVTIGRAITNDNIDIDGIYIGQTNANEGELWFDLDEVTDQSLITELSRFNENN